jgi:hypothetical protein
MIQAIIFIKTVLKYYKNITQSIADNVPFTQSGFADFGMENA